MATQVNIYAKTMAHLHGGATTFAQPHYNCRGTAGVIMFVPTNEMLHAHVDLDRLTLPGILDNLMFGMFALEWQNYGFKSHTKQDVTICV